MTTLFRKANHLIAMETTEDDPKHARAPAAVPMTAGQLAAQVPRELGLEGAPPGLVDAVEAMRKIMVQQAVDLESMRARVREQPPPTKADVESAGANVDRPEFARFLQMLKETRQDGYRPPEREFIRPSPIVARNSLRELHPEFYAHLKAARDGLRDKGELNPDSFAHLKSVRDGSEDKEATNESEKK